MTHCVCLFFLCFVVSIQEERLMIIIITIIIIIFIIIIFIICTAPTRHRVQSSWLKNRLTHNIRYFVHSCDGFDVVWSLCGFVTCRCGAFFHVLSCSLAYFSVWWILSCIVITMFFSFVYGLSTV